MSYSRTPIPKWPVFARFPDDWRGKTIEVWADGNYTLDSGAISAERKAGGEFPIRTLLITATLSGGEMMDWIEHILELLGQPT